MFSLRRTLSFALVALSLLSFSTNVDAAQVRGNNAHRLARGLAPAPPKRLYDPRRNRARDTVSTTTTTSPTPTVTPGQVITGYAGVYPASATDADPNELLGYMGAYGLTQSVGTGSAADAWQYSFTEPDPLGSVVELNHPGTPYRWSGVAIRSGPQVTLGPGNSYYLELQNTRAHTPAGSASSTYVYDTYAIGYAQTTIFSVDPITGQLTVKWVNPDGSIPTTYIAISGGNIYVTGDLSALAAQLGTTPTPVNIYINAS